MSKESWYSKLGNKKRLMEYNRKRQLRNRIFLAERKSSAGCIVCGETHPGCLDFHHRDPKNKTKCVSKLADCKASFETLKAEIEKCDVICANCHRRKHWEESRVGLTMSLGVENP